MRIWGNRHRSSAVQPVSRKNRRVGLKFASRDRSKTLGEREKKDLTWSLVKPEPSRTVSFSSTLFWS